MSIENLKAANAPDLMKSTEGNDSRDAIIKHGIGKEPSLPFSRAGDSSVQFIQLLHALEQQEHQQTWPLFSPLKMQMQKCDKCSREFFSPINYRRHIRVHHRLKMLDKDSTKSRDLLGAFWDKLSLEDAKEVVSFKNVALEEVPGSSIMKELSSLVRKSGFLSLPQPYLKAGFELFDIVQGKPSRFPISSQELFSILDHASEKTFLSGPAVSMQRYVFDGEARKTGLETKNLVACTSFLLEQKLVKTWLAEKDAEALRFQKLLMEEEEAAQKRQAELLERKRQKKLRQKEQKAKEQRHGEKADVDECIGEVEAMLPVETFSPVACDHMDTPDMPNHVPLSILEHCTSDGNMDSEFQAGFDCGPVDSGNSSNVERQIVQGSGRQQRWQVSPKSQWVASTGFHATTPSSQSSKLGAMQNCRTHRDLRTASTGHKVWARKAKPDFGGDILKARVPKEALNKPDQITNHEVLIGSISVTLGNCSQEGSNLSEACDTCLLEHQMPKNSFQDKPNKPDPVRSGTSRPTGKLWRPVSRNGTKVPMPAQNSNRESEANMIVEKDHRETQCNNSSPRLSILDDHCGGIANISKHLNETGNSELSSHAVKAFLEERWKEAIALDHVKLVLTPDSETIDFAGIENDTQETEFQLLKFHKRNILGDAENRLPNVEILGSPTAGAAKAKYRTKPEKGVKKYIAYIAKQRTPT